MTGLVAGEHIHHVPRGGDGEQVAAQLRAARHRLPVDVAAQRRQDTGCFLGNLLHVVGKAGMGTVLAFG